MTTHKTPNNQRNLDKKSEVGGITIPDFKAVQSRSNKTSMVVA
jgi:hypothetical protein